MRHAAVNLEFLERHAGVGVHRVEDFGALERGRLLDGAGDVTLVDVAGQAHDRAASIRTPVGSEQAGERGDEVDATVILDRAGQLADVRRLDDHAQVVAQPLDQRTGDGDRASRA